MRHECTTSFASQTRSAHRDPSTPFAPAPDGGAELTERESDLLLRRAEIGELLCVWIEPSGLVHDFGTEQILSVENADFVALALLSQRHLRQFPGIAVDSRSPEPVQGNAAAVPNRF